TLQIGNGGATGSLDANSPVVNNAILVFNSSGSFNVNNVISGSGRLVKQGSGVLTLLADNTYTGGTTINSGGVLRIFQGNGTQGSVVGPVTNNGAFILHRQNDTIIAYPIVGTGSLVKEPANAVVPGTITLTGTNTYTGGTTNQGGNLILGDNATPF